MSAGREGVSAAIGAGAGPGRGDVDVDVDAAQQSSMVPADHCEEGGKGMVGSTSGGSDQRCEETIWLRENSSEELSVKALSVGGSGDEPPHEDEPSIEVVDAGGDCGKVRSVSSRIGEEQSGERAALRTGGVCPVENSEELLLDADADGSGGGTLPLLDEKPKSPAKVDGVALSPQAERCVPAATPPTAAAPTPDSVYSTTLTALATATAVSETAAAGAAPVAVTGAADAEAAVELVTVSASSLSTYAYDERPAGAVASNMDSTVMSHPAAASSVITQPSAKTMLGRARDSTGIAPDASTAISLAPLLVKPDADTNSNDVSGAGARPTTVPGGAMPVEQQLVAQVAESLRRIVDEVERNLAGGVGELISVATVALPPSRGVDEGVGVGVSGGDGSVEQPPPRSAPVPDGSTGSAGVSSAAVVAPAPLDSTTVMASLADAAVTRNTDSASSASILQNSRVAQSDSTDVADVSEVTEPSAVVDLAASPSFVDPLAWGALVRSSTATETLRHRLTRATSPCVACLPAHDLGGNYNPPIAHVASCGGTSSPVADGIQSRLANFAYSQLGFGSPSAGSTSGARAEALDVTSDTDSTPRSEERSPENAPSATGASAPITTRQPSLTDGDGASNSENGIRSSSSGSGGASGRLERGGGANEGLFTTSLASFGSVHTPVDPAVHRWLAGASTPSRRSPRSSLGPKRVVSSTTRWPPPPPVPSSPPSVVLLASSASTQPRNCEDVASCSDHSNLPPAARSSKARAVAAAVAAVRDAAMLREDTAISPVAVAAVADMENAALQHEASFGGGLQNARLPRHISARGSSSAITPRLSAPSAFQANATVRSSPDSPFSRSPSIGDNTALRTVASIQNPSLPLPAGNPPTGPMDTIVGFGQFCSSAAAWPTGSDSGASLLWAGMVAPTPPLTTPTTTTAADRPLSPPVECRRGLAVSGETPTTPTKVSRLGGVLLKRHSQSSVTTTRRGAVKLVGREGGGLARLSPAAAKQVIKPASGPGPRTGMMDGRCILAKKRDRPKEESEAGVPPPRLEASGKTLPVGGGSRLCWENSEVSGRKRVRTTNLMESNAAVSLRSGLGGNGGEGSAQKDAAVRKGVMNAKVLHLLFRWSEGMGGERRHHRPQRQPQQQWPDGTDELSLLYCTGE